MRTTLYGLGLAMQISVAGWVVGAPFNPSRYLAVTATNYPDIQGLSWAVAMDGDQMIAAGRDSGTNGYVYLLQRHYGGADTWSVRSSFLVVTSLEGPSDVDIAGDIAVVGATTDDTGAVDAGAVHILYRNYPTADAWGRRKFLQAPSVMGTNRFGSSVSTDGRYLAVSSLSTNAVYLYARNAGGADNWGLVKTIPNPYPANLNDAAVSVDGDRLAIGSFRISTNQAVRLYERNAGGADNWGLVKTITPADGQSTNQFGYSVALSGDRLAVGAYADDDAGGGLDGSVYLFDRNMGGSDQWGQVVKRLPDSNLQGQMGRSVDLCGDTLVAAASQEPGARAAFPEGGALYVFQRNAGGADAWGRTARLLGDTNSAELGYSAIRQGVSLGDDTLAAAVDDQITGLEDGIRVFREYDCPDWVEVRRLTGDTPRTNAQFGAAVCLDDDLLVGGRPQRSGTAPAEGGYITLARNDGGADGWGQTAAIANGANTNGLLGTAVAFHDRHLLVGAPGNGGSGEVLVRVRGSNGWSDVAIPNLVSPDAQPGESFGSAVAVWDDVAVIGAPLNDTVAANAGAAFVYSRNQGGADNWGFVRRLNGSGQASGDEVGRSIDIYRDTIAVGAPYEFDASGGDGAVYIFRMNQGGSNTWGEVKKIKVPVVAGLQNFGWSVSLWGDLLAVGDISDSETINQGGAVYVFERNRGGLDNWGLVKRITPPVPELAAAFGTSVDLRGGRLLVGEPLRDGALADEGRAYVYERNMDGTDQWGLVTRIDPPTPQAGAWFGTAVAMSADRLCVGAAREDVGAVTNGGAVYVFQPGCLRITTTNDVVNAGDGLTSLREVIALANASTQAQFTVDIPDGTFGIASASFSITNKRSVIVLRGQGARRTALDGRGTNTVLYLYAGTTGDVRNVTIKNGHAPDGAAGVGANDGGHGMSGGGVFMEGDWRIIASTIVSNAAGDGGNAQVGQGTWVGHGGYGGGVAVFGTLTLRQCTISHNRAGNAGATGDIGDEGGDGGGVYVFGINTLSATILNCTLYGNSAGEGSGGKSDGDGGGIADGSGALVVRHSTISHNHAGSGADRGDGGGIFLFDPATVNFSIVNNNDAQSASPDIRGTLVSPSYNLISNTNGCTFSGSPVSNIVGVLALIGGSPANYGGPTDTMMPQPGSPVINKGDASFGSPLPLDQRGYLRPTNGITIDIGAVETTTDFDGDGVPDEWEWARGTDYEEPADGAIDLDGDGLSGVQEYIMDANPYDSDPLAVVQIVQTGVTARLQVPSSTSRVYSLQTTLSLTGGVWSPIPSQQDVPGNGGLLTLIHTNAVPARGYRVVVELP